mgnify:CR=1 FL=1
MHEITNFCTELHIFAQNYKVIALFLTRQSESSNFSCMINDDNVSSKLTRWWWYTSAMIIVSAEYVDKLSLKCFELKKETDKTQAKRKIFASAFNDPVIVLSILFKNRREKPLQ